MRKYAESAMLAGLGLVKVLVLSGLVAGIVFGAHLLGTGLLQSGIAEYLGVRLGGSPLAAGVTGLLLIATCALCSALVFWFLKTMGEGMRERWQEAKGPWKKIGAALDPRLPMPVQVNVDEGHDQGNPMW
jgi:hypothetical protein